MSRVMQAEPRGLQWVAMSRGSFPKFAVEAGIDSGKKLYVARASHAGGVVPGKLHVGHSSAYIAYDGKEISMPNYEVLIGPTASLSWVESSNGQVPQHAVIGDFTSLGFERNEGSPENPPFPFIVINFSANFFQLKANSN
ncbi:uncharacterized protein LOC110861924 isoform X2 [Folsomia candida]|uniref:uncharacterized protein LOC110861924 isoform X2 n=1 Tax=Folsomia candida TaxID=158441 RepID=UPI001604D90C|nr:uncharacterized protein LOC110861924 isoform X2 [Folsomia candida]